MDAALNRNGWPWYERAWTIQEFLLAKRLFLYFNKERIVYRPNVLEAIIDAGFTGFRFDDFAHALTWRLSNTEREMAPPWSGAPPRKIPILEAVIALGGVQATHPRDMVYSLLGLINQEDARYIGVDYDFSCDKLYVMATFASFRFSGNLDMLQLVAGRASHQQTRVKDLPTWCVNFEHVPWIEHGRGSRLNNSTLLLKHDDGYARQLRWRDRKSMKPSLDSSLRILRCGGMELDSISDTLHLFLSDRYTGQALVPVFVPSSDEESNLKLVETDEFIQCAASV